MTDIPTREPHNDVAGEEYTWESIVPREQSFSVMAPSVSSGRLIQREVWRILDTKFIALFVGLRCVSRYLLQLMY